MRIQAETRAVTAKSATNVAGRKSGGDRLGAEAVFSPQNLDSKSAHDLCHDLVRVAALLILSRWRSPSQTEVLRYGSEEPLWTWFEWDLGLEKNEQEVEKSPCRLEAQAIGWERRDSRKRKV